MRDKHGADENCNFASLTTFRGVSPRRPCGGARICSSVLPHFAIMPMPLKDLTGMKFGRLTVVARAPRSAKNYTMWECKCECGESKVILTMSLKPGGTRSCGCIMRETFLKHGNARKGEHTSEYNIWLTMKQRIQKPNSPSYKNYGGRGITMCDRWESFENFLCDMGCRPTKNHSLDRIDNGGGYSPENCRWATSMEQGGNTRRNRMIEYRGETKHLSEWARLKGIHITTLHRRLGEGYTPEEAIEIPINAGRPARLIPQKQTDATQA